MVETAELAGGHRNEKGKLGLVWGGKAQSTKIDLKGMSFMYSTKLGQNDTNYTCVHGGHNTTEQMGEKEKCAYGRNSHSMKNQKTPIVRRV